MSLYKKCLNSKYNKDDCLKKSFDHNFYELSRSDKVNFYDKQKIKELMEQIKNLKEEITDLKEEIEMLKAVNQEC